eukprot:4289178-Amphidinium_carterae.2
MSISPGSEHHNDSELDDDCGVGNVAPSGNIALRHSVSAESLGSDCGVRTSVLKRKGTAKFFVKKQRKVTWSRPPTTVADLRSWPELYLKRIESKGLMKNITEKMDCGVMLDSDYTGSGCMEQAATLIRDQLAVVHPHFDRSWLRAHRACDIDHRCRTLLQRHNARGLKASHIFRDLCDRLTASTQEKLRCIAARWSEHRVDLCSCFPKIRCEHKAINKLVGDAMTKEMVEFMLHVGEKSLDPAQKCWCDVHNRECFLYDCSESNAHPYKRLNIWSGGNRCLDWSSFGRQEGWNGEDIVPFMSWLFSMKMMKPDIWIQECTPRFDMSLFHTVLGELYHIQQRCLSPMDMGWPVSRKRQWSIGVLKSRLKVVVELSDPAFDEIFCREVESKCDVFFKDSVEQRRHAMREQRKASERGFEVRRVKKIQKLALQVPQRLNECLSPGPLFRLQGYMEKCALEPRFRLADCVVANVTQDPSSRPVLMSKTLPCLLTKSVMVLLKSHALGINVDGEEGPLLMTAREHLAAMGWPMLGDAAGVCLLDGALSGVSNDLMKHIAGNGMHITVAGAMLLYAFSCTASIEHD